MDRATFDRFASNYSDVLDQSLKYSGEHGDYFYNYKLRCLKQWVVPETPGLSILDFGCGIGKLASMVAESFPDCTVQGVDESRECLNAAHDSYSGVENLSFGESIPSDCKYDVIYLASVLHHIRPADRSGLLNALKDALRDRGRIAVFEHNPWNPLTQHLAWTCPFDADAKLVRRGALVRMGLDLGLRVVLKRFIVFFPRFLSRLRRFEDRLGRLPLGAQYLVVFSRNRSPYVIPES